MKAMWVYPALLAASSTALAVDMNIQYVQSTSALTTAQSSPSFQSETVERTINLGRTMFENQLSALSTSIELHEHLTAKYSALSYSSVGLDLQYDFQSNLNIDAASYSARLNADYTFVGNPIYRGASFTAALGRFKPIAPRWQWQTVITLENQWRDMSELSEQSISFGTGLDYRVTAKLYLYGFTELEMGQLNLDTTEKDSGSIENRLLSDQRETNWFIKNGNGVLMTSILGVNMPLAEDLTFDFAVEHQGGQLLNTSVSKFSSYFSLFFRF